MMPFATIEPLPRVMGSLAEPWMFPVLVGLVILVAVANVAGRRWIASGMVATVSPQVFRELAREEGRVLTGVPLLLMVVSLTCTAFVLYAAMATFGTAAIAFWKILLMVAMVFGMKQLTLTAADQLAGGHPGLMATRFDHSLSYQVAGMVLLPLTVFVVYAQPGTARVLLVLSLAVLLVAYVGRIARGVVLAVRTRTPLFYIIFYLCALEILPLAVLVRLAIAD